MIQTPHPPKRMCMHCKRPFVFNDELRYFAHKKWDSLPCDICDEINYLVKEKSKPVLFLLSIIFGLIAVLPLGACLLFVLDTLGEQARVRIFLLVAISFIGFTITTFSLNVIIRHYIWTTHKLSNRFESPFLDNLNRPSK